MQGSNTNAKQPRALVTEQKFLRSLDALLRKKSFNQTSIQEIADHAGLQKAAFLKRFKSKHAALIALFGIYCVEVNKNIDRLDQSIPNVTNIDQFLIATCKTLDELLTEHFPANRAMYKHFVDTLVVATQTREIFKATAELIFRAQCFHKVGNFKDKEAAFMAAQILISLSFDYKFGAMPALPSDPARRYDFLSRQMLVALNFTNERPPARLKLIR